MAKGENIFKRKDGRWEARYIKGYELSGKIKYGFCYGKTYKEAKEKVTRAKAALVSGKPAPVSNTRHRFAYFCDEWFESGKKQIQRIHLREVQDHAGKTHQATAGRMLPIGF